MTNYSRNQLNQYTEATGELADVFTHDLDGNLTGTGSWSYVYDAQNRLKEAIQLPVQTGSLKVEYTYDYLGRRVEKRRFTRSGSSYQQNLHHKYVYQGWDLLAIVEGGNGTSLLQTFTWGPTAGGGWGGAGGLALAWTNHTHYFPVTDGRQNNVGMISETGNWLQTSDFDAFGNLRAQSGTFTFGFTWKGYFYDADVELYYLGYRFYSPKTGRFLTRDPIGEAGGLNLYAHVRGDAINHYDILGLSAAPVNAGENVELPGVSYGRTIPWWAHPQSFNPAHMSDPALLIAVNDAPFYNVDSSGSGCDSCGGEGQESKQERAQRKKDCDRLRSRMAEMSKTWAESQESLGNKDFWIDNPIKGDSEFLSDLLENMRREIFSLAEMSVSPLPGASHVLSFGFKAMDAGWKYGEGDLSGAMKSVGGVAGKGTQVYLERTASSSSAWRGVAATGLKRAGHIGSAYTLYSIFESPLVKEINRLQKPDMIVNSEAVYYRRLIGGAKNAIDFYNIRYNELNCSEFY